MDDRVPRSLEHPLPAGMHDLLPEEARSRRMLARSVLDRFALFGYRVVIPPAFELAEVIERGLGPLADVLRFIEPESGEVAALRPDMTPQIARIVATRLRDRTPPHRLAYEGTVVRRRVGRAKKHRQVPQVGVELCGVAGVEGDLEVLSLAAEALSGAGLPRFTIDLSDAGIVRGLLEGVNADHALAVTAALARKDEAVLEDVTRGLPSRRELVSLTRLHGGRDALVAALDVLRGTAAESAAARLLDLYDAATASGLGPHLSADAGEVRGFAYYTGPMFSLYAEGAGEPLGGGGRYDELLSRFGCPMPAMGLALDLDALARAVRTVDVPTWRGAGVVVVGGADDPRVGALRARGTPAVAVVAHEQAVAYARSWAYAAVWSDGVLYAGGREHRLGGSIDDAVTDVVRALSDVR